MRQYGSDKLGWKQPEPETEPEPTRLDRHYNQGGYDEKGNPRRSEAENPRRPEPEEPSQP